MVEFRRFCRGSCTGMEEGRRIGVQTRTRSFSRLRVLQGGTFPCTFIDTWPIFSGERHFFHLTLLRLIFLVYRATFGHVRNLLRRDERNLRYSLARRTRHAESSRSLEGVFVRIEATVRSESHSTFGAASDVFESRYTFTANYEVVGICFY